MSDPYVHRTQQSAAQYYGWDKVPTVDQKPPLVTPFDPSRGWALASRTQKTLAILSPLSLLMSLVPLGVPVLHDFLFLFALAAIVLGAFSFYALHKILRPLVDPNDVERKLRYSAFAIWWGMMTPAAAGFIGAGLYEQYGSDIMGYLTVLFIGGYVFLLLGLVVLSFWTLVALVVRMSQR